jgi:hypothetical protein
MGVVHPRHAVAAVRVPGGNPVMKKQSKKIVLAKETLRELSTLATGKAVGGSRYPNTNFNSCPWPTLSCKAGQC